MNMQSPETVPTADRLLAEATIVIDGKTYLKDAKGGLMPESIVRPTDKLQDQLVRKMMGYAIDLSAQVGRFKNHCQADVAAYMQLIADEYGATQGGAKGNITFTSYDGTLKVQVAVADRIAFGPEIQVAKSLINECLGTWSEGVRDELRALVNEAFRTDSEGEVSRDGVFRLMRVDIQDEVWRRAMTAIRDSIRVDGTKSYIRFYRRETAESDWEAVTINLAAA